MRYLWLVAWREFMENARTKGFWIGIFLFPLLIILAGTLPILLAKKGVSARHYVLVDQTDAFAPQIREEMRVRRLAEIDGARADYARKSGTEAATPAAPEGTGASPALGALPTPPTVSGQPGSPTGFVPPRATWLEVPVPTGVDPATNLVTLENQLRPWLRGERILPPSEVSPTPRLFAAVIIPRGYGNKGEETNAVRYWAENQADTDLRETIQRILSRELRRREYRELGVDPDLVARVEARRAPVTELNPRKSEGNERVGLADRLRQWAPSFFVYLLWVSIFAVSQMLLNSVIEEKSNRIIEVLLSSVTPGELMLGKLLGVAMTGAVMMLSWFGSLVGVALLQSLGSGAGGTAAQAAQAAQAGPAATLSADVLGLLQSSWLLPGFAAYFILGYIAYATIFLTIGSLCSTLKDAQNFMGPVMLILMVPLFLMPFVPRDPNGPIATVFSWIPLYTPFIMMNRITASPPVFDVVGTGLLLVAFDILVLWGCGRVFRLAILRTGQPPRIMELFRWIRGR